MQQWDEDGLLEVYQRRRPCYHWCVRKGKKMPLAARILLDAVLALFLCVLVTGYLAVRPPVRKRMVLTPSLFGLTSEDVSFLTSDGKTLRGWFIPATRPKGTIICCHGYPASREQVLPRVRFLHADYHLLLFDFRAHGESDGRLVTFGLREVRDVEAALGWLAQDPRTKDTPIGIWGYSMGAAVAILAAANHPEIRAVVSDSAFASFPDMITRFYRFLGPAKYAASALARFLGRKLLHMDYLANSPETQVAHLSAALLVIHAREDEFVPFSHAERIFARAREPKKLFPVTGSHTAHGTADPSLYEDEVKRWFDTYLRRQGFADTMIPSGR